MFTFLSFFFYSFSLSPYLSAFLPFSHLPSLTPSLHVPATIPASLFVFLPSSLFRCLPTFLPPISLTASLPSYLPTSLFSLFIPCYLSSFFLPASFLPSLLPSVFPSCMYLLCLSTPSFLFSFNICYKPHRITQQRINHTEIHVFSIIIFQAQGKLAAKSNLLDFAIAAQYIHGKDSASPFLDEVIQNTPDWIFGNHWVDTYKSWSFTT